MRSNRVLRPREGETVTRAAPRRAPLRRWEWRPVAHGQGAPRFLTGTAEWTLADLRLRPAGRLNPTQRRRSSPAIERRGRRTPDIRGRALRLGPTLAPLPAKVAGSYCRGRKPLRGLIVPFGGGHAFVRKGFERQDRELFHGPTSARECRRASIRLRRRRRSLGQRPVELPEAGCAPRRP
jgi:hypothetical protein